MELYTWTDNGKSGGFFGSRLVRWILASEGKAFCTRFEFANKVWWHMPIAVVWHDQTGLYTVHDKRGMDAPLEAPDRIMIARRERIFRYRRGVADRVKRLARKYFIDRVPYDAGDVVIDCGANVGEVGLHIKSRAAVRLIAIEPSILEAKACDENLFCGRHDTLRFALWDSAGQQAFYDSNVTGDSSLIPPATAHVGVTNVRTATLEQLIDAQGVDRIKLLKIEGEGAEPEILSGGAKIISRVAYCTVDCGPERGASQAHVIPQVCNFLIGSGFELLDVNLERQIFWFRNRKIK